MAEEGHHTADREPLTEFLAGRGAAPSRRELNRLIDRLEWFTTARRARALTTGEPDPALTLPLGFWPTVPPVAKPEVSVVSEAPETLATPEVSTVSAEPATPEISTASAASETPDTPETTAADLIDRFIEHGGYRIDPAGEALEATVDIDIDPEMVTEELAEIYRSQGLVAEAEKIARILKAE